MNEDAVMEKLTQFDEDLYNEIHTLSVKIESYKDLAPRIEQELNRLFSDYLFSNKLRNYNRFKSVKVFQYFLDINNFLITHGYKVWIFEEWELENLNDSSNNEKLFIFKVSIAL